jgi:alanyl-tRNA synthetase
MEEQITTEVEKDTFFKRLKRGFKVLLDKAKETAENIQKNNESKESNDFFDTGGFTQPVEEKKKEKDPFDIDLNNITRCDL